MRNIVFWLLGSLAVAVPVASFVLMAMAFILVDDLGLIGVVMVILWLVLAPTWFLIFFGLALVAANPEDSRWKERRRTFLIVVGALAALFGFSGVLAVFEQPGDIIFIWNWARLALFAFGATLVWTYRRGV